MLNPPISMKFKSKVKGPVLKDAYTEISGAHNKYQSYEVLGDVEEQVSVYNMGLPDPFGCEFLFYYPNWAGPYSTESASCLGMVLSAQRGWGTSNCRNFTP